MIKKILPLLLLVCCNTYCQGSFEVYDSIKKLSVKNIEKITDSMIEVASKNKEYKEAASIADSYSRVLFSKRKYNKTLFYCKKRMEYRAKISKEDIEYVKTLYNVGLLYRYNEQYDLAIKYLENLLALKICSTWTY